MLRVAVRGCLLRPCVARVLGCSAPPGGITWTRSASSGSSSSGSGGSGGSGVSGGAQPSPSRVAISQQLALYNQLVAAAKVQAQVAGDAPPKPIPVVVEGRVMDVPSGVWAPSSVFKPQGGALRCACGGGLAK